MTLLHQDIASDILNRLLSICTGPDSTKARIILLRGLLDELYKELTRDASVSLSGLFARMQFLREQVSLPDALNQQANLLRILGNQCAHENGFEPSDTDLFSCAWVMRALLHWYQEELDLNELDQFLQEHRASPFPDRPHARKHSFLGVVLSWKLKHGDQQNTGIEITAAEEDGRSVCIYLRDDPKSEGRKWSLLDRCLWKWATINCLNLSESSGAADQYIDNPGTMIVIEPDYLIDVSALAECVSSKGVNPELAVLGRLISEESTQSLAIGSAVNNIFDELMFDPDADYNQLFRDSMARAPIPLVALGKEAALQVHGIIRDEHLPRLRAMARFAHQRDMMLEPSFISPKYGLQGRLDLLYKDKGRYYIVELKSGNAPQTGIWPQHLYQVVGYNLLIKECYGAANLGTSSILYSKLPDDKLRGVTNLISQEQELLMCRNRVIGIWKLLSENPATFFDWLKSHEGNQLAGFVKERLHRVQSILNALDPLEYEWYLEQVRLAVRETWYVKIGSGTHRSESGYGYNALWQQSREEKLRRYKLLPALKLVAIDKNLLRFKLEDRDRISDFREGDVVVAYREDRSVSAQEIIRGELITLGEETLLVRARGVLNPTLFADLDRLWSIEHDLLESMLFGTLASITGFLAAPENKRRKLLGLMAPEFQTDGVASAEDVESIVAQIDAARDYCVVQGPPGTGKTSGLITSFIRRLYQNSDQTILILSFTNRAVDEICSNLARHQIPHIRTGRSQNVELELLGNLIRDKRFDEIEEIVKTNRVWVATVQSCNSWINDWLRIIPGIGTLIIDEASQIIEPNILGIIARAERCVLIGDQNQLPPIVAQTDATYSFTAAELRQLCYSGYNRSLMERLFLLSEQNGWPQARFMLNRHYRMHDEIAALVQQFYHHDLISCTPRQQRTLESSETTPAYLKNRVVWIDCPPATHAYYDEEQCVIIHRLLDKLIHLGEITELATGVGIVAPYRAMIQALRAELGSPFSAMTIDTVERFQGSERDIIIITLPLRDKADLRTLEAVSDDQKVDRKLNVSLSRAKERLIILGNSSLCASSGHYAFLIDRIRASQTLIPSSQLID